MTIYIFNPDLPKKNIFNPVKIIKKYIFVIENIYFVMVFIERIIIYLK
jgi:hypothetical protein